MNNNVTVGKIFVAFLIILGLLFFWWKLGIYDIIGNMIGSGTPSPDGSYKAVTVDKLYDDLKNNAIVAEDEYLKKYVAITGKIGIIETNYIGIFKINDDYSLDYVSCYFTNDEQKNAIKSMNKGDIVTVKGKISKISKVFGYYLDITETPK